MKIDLGNDEIVELEVDSFDEFPRNDYGRCALCDGDPCAEFTDGTTNIDKFYKNNPGACTCPVCDGRPT